jgi:RNA polymerase sigma-70 factor (ECF subfamily)
VSVDLGTVEREREFTSFVDARYGRLRLLATALAGDQDAEDVLHEALAKTYGRWRRRGAPDNPEAYVRQVMLHDVQRSWRRRRHGDLGAVDERALPMVAGTTPLEPDAIVALWRAVANLPPRQRAVVVLRYALGLSEAETALEMNCSVGTVKSQSSRALAKLRETVTAMREGSE